MIGLQASISCSYSEVVVNIRLTMSQQRERLCVNTLPYTCSSREDLKVPHSIFIHEENYFTARIGIFDTLPGFWIQPDGNGI